jgi:NADH:quinone reductase (non-electrogenic)
VKDALVRATELDTRLVMRPLRNTERVLRNSAVDKIVAIEKEKGAATTIDDIREYVAGAYVKVMQEGDMEAGAWSCGMVAGLIHDVPTCQELIDRIMSEADVLIAQRLAGMRAA